MRDFTKTAEPSGARAPRGRGSIYVIQQHAARRMHYDFRLELDGVLLSWAVPKGPSLSPTERRLAVRTEDHPLDYASFEGIIPKGEYGGGTVSVWDQGTWQPESDPQDAMRRGRLTFTLDGQKLKGRWHLVRTKPVGAQEQWLLFKGRDEIANDNLDIVSSRPESVISGRTVDEIAGDADRVWHSDPAVDIAALVKQLPIGFPMTNLDKVLYPEDRITKAQLIAYYAVVAEHMLPQLADRPLTLVRCPEGIKKQCFFQKKILPGSPKSIGTVKLHEKEGGAAVEYMKVSDMAGIVGLAQLGTLEIHTWGCHADKVERPDIMVFDLDPDPGVAWDRVALAALETRRRLGELGFTSYVKTTGGKGLHVCAPIKRTIDWESFKAFTKVFADKMSTDEPKLYTSNMAKAARRGKIFVDYLRNGRNATFITPYSTRARPHAPVAVPLTWEELAKGVDPAAFTTATVPARLAKLKKDPWAGIDDLDQGITAASWRALGATPPKGGKR
jgi:bifunctional non-homologous end joining protein LigD